MKISLSTRVSVTYNSFPKISLVFSYEIIFKGGEISVNVHVGSFVILLTSAVGTLLTAGIDCGFC